MGIIGTLYFQVLALQSYQLQIVPIQCCIIFKLIQHTKIIRLHTLTINRNITVKFQQFYFRDASK